MVAVWPVSATGDSITLSDAKVFSTDEIKVTGRDPKYSERWLEAVKLMMQSGLDKRIPLADLPPDEETIGWTAVEMEAVYGGRMWWDKGDLVSRNIVVVAVLWDGVKLNLSLRNS